MSCVLIYSKNTLYREYLGKIVKNDKYVNTVVSVNNTVKIPEVVAEDNPSFVIIDLYSRNFDDNILIEVSKYFTGKQIILITTIENRHLNYYNYAYGIRHYIYAEEPSEEITQALTRMFSGDGINGRFSGTYALTSRECEILRLIASGNTSKEIAEMLCISKNTVDTHRNKMLQKLNLANSASLVHYAYRSGLF